VVVAAAVLAATIAYPSAFGAEIHPLGPDMFGYIWETRLVGIGALNQVGTRPGVPVLGSVLSGFHTVGSEDAPLILGLVMAVALGLAAAAAVRLAFRLPGWSLGVISFTVAMWGGVIHLSKGYLANELSLVCMAVALLLVALPGRHDRARMLGGFAAATAAGLAHPGFLPFYATVECMWLLLALPRLIGGRQTGHGWREDAAVRSIVILSAAACVTGLVIFGFMGLHVSDVTNLTDGVREFSGQLVVVRRSIGLWVGSAPILAAVGMAAAWRLRGSSSRDLTRVGLAWGICSVAGGLATLLRPSLPGFRALLVILPLPAAAGLGMVWVARGLASAGRRRVGAEAEPKPLVNVMGAIAAAGAIAVGCVLIAAPGLSGLRAQGKEPVRGDPARLVASYVATVNPTTPVVVFTRPTTERTALAWRGRQNQVRAYVPTSNIASTFVVVGELGGANGATPEPIGSSEDLLNGWLAYSGERSWTEGGPALRDGAIVVAPQVYNDPSVWKVISNDAARIVAPGLAVLRGPTTVPLVSITPASVPRGEAIMRALACLVLLAMLGGGFAAAGTRALEATPLDTVGLAPAAGVVLVVLAGISVSLTGSDPAGPVGVGVVAGVASAGYALAWRTAVLRRDAP
jgi:hypothetical protein